MKISNLLWGILFIVVGFILGSNSLGFTNINIFFDGWWTLLIIIPCFIDLFKDDDKTGDIIGIVVGIGLLFACNDIIDFGIILKLIFPFILVMVGLSFIFKDSVNKKVKKEIDKIKINDKNDYWALFGSESVDLTNQEFDGCSINSIFGDVKLDISNSLFKDDCVIKISAIFGSVTLLVDDDIEVKISSIPIFGSVNDKRKLSKKKKSDNDVVIYIDALCMFGGVDIK